MSPNRRKPAAPTLSRYRWCGVALAVWALMDAAAAQTPPAPEVEIAPVLHLRPTGMLAEAITPAQRDAAPVFVQGDRITGRADLETVIEGSAEFRKAGTTIKADRLEYDQPSDTAKANGNVRINRGGNVYSGPQLELKVDAFEGFFRSPSYEFQQTDAHGEADRADFIDDRHAVIRNATYTTCRRQPGPDWLPAWILRAAKITLDNDEDVGVATNAVLSFQGVPILPVPAISFPLSEKRKSGLLPPTIGVDNVNGIEVTQPYYWNIAPNRDATITPTVMSLRGVDLGVEFRYLEPAYNGIARVNYMPADTLRGSDRWGVAYTHQGTVQTGLPSVGAVGVSLNLNRVSDDNYWRDFTRSSSTLTQRLLPNDVSAQWAQGPVSANVRMLQWQTLQDPTAPIIPPYDRVPQIGARYERSDSGGWDWSVDGDFTQFQATSALTLQPNAQRVYSLAQISRPWLAPAGFFTPKLQLHASTYQFDARLTDGSAAADSVVPTFSLDSGLVFERNAQLLGRSLVQTLEPRAFYVYTPYKDQSRLPNYDTGVNDFNFASIYTENAFVGHDKIADNNLMTLGLTTRLLDADTGTQLARFGMAQRLRFEDQRVTLNAGEAPAQAGFSDILLGASVNVNDHWGLESTVQYNSKTDQSERATVGARYNPGNYRVLNGAYRYQRDSSEQVDVSWQWPLNDLWGDKGKDLGVGRGQGVGRLYSVGRLNYSLNERRLVDTVLGVEYDAGCWLGRVVLERLQTSTTTATERLSFQLEFVGFTRLGFGSQKTLDQNISRYQNLRDSSGSSSRFSNYD
jgi:LPS-assembly protein